MQCNDTTAVLSDLLSLDSLRALNGALTELMAKQRIQPVIRAENLDAIVDRVVSLALEEGEDGRLVAAAMIGRLGAVAKSRKDEVFSKAQDLLVEVPPTIDGLTDGDEKAYAATTLGHVDQEWIFDYCVSEALSIENAERARRRLLYNALVNSESLSTWLSSIAVYAKSIRIISDTEKKLRRARRIWDAMCDVIGSWQGRIDESAGESLSNCLASFRIKQTPGIDARLFFGVFDSAHNILVRFIELQFSHALSPDTYTVIATARNSTTSANWRIYLDESEVVPRLKTILLEASLVLARQNRTDRRMMNTLHVVYPSIPQLSSAITRHFSSAHDIDSDISGWWISGGATHEGKRAVEQKAGNTIDEQIGSLLIEVETYRDTMTRMKDSVVPFLNISDPVLASTVRKAASGYEEMAQTTQRLARIRRLSKTDLKGAIIEYNLLEHDMIEGHKAGVRTVRVVKEGVKKDFGGKVRTLIKPLVEPAD